MTKYKVIALSCFCPVDNNTYDAGDTLPDGLHETDAKELIGRGFIEVVGSAALAKEEEPAKGNAAKK